MNFVSLTFVLFLVLIFLLFHALPKIARMPLLLLASYLFYASWSVPFIAVLVFSTSVDYWMSRLITRTSLAKYRNSFLIFGIVINVLILIFFKYYNFLLQPANGLMAWLTHSTVSLPVLQIILPLGISFYTFEAISYLVDAYRGKPVAQNWLEYNFYILYFPHLISGPIIRFCELMPQYRMPLQRPSLLRVASGCELILLGYLFKILIADYAASWVDPVFKDPGSFSVLQKNIAVLAFTVQIYFDFMGYTHIARGVSLLFNIELPLNFNYPYLATNISNFWERWHISLSRWIRDYLYFPLGGSKGSFLQTVFNLLFTMLICGAWHGAAWMFIFWGGYHGLLLVLYHVLKQLKARFNSVFLSRLESHFVYRTVSILLTFFCVMVGWILFRAPNMETFQAISGSFLNMMTFSRELLAEILSGQYENLHLLLLLLSLCWAGPWVAHGLQSLYRKQPLWIKVQVACLVLVLCWILTAEGTVPFIYFQF